MMESQGDLVSFPDPALSRGKVSGDIARFSSPDPFPRERAGSGNETIPRTRKNGWSHAFSGEEEGVAP